MLTSTVDSPHGLCRLVFWRHLSEKLKKRVKFIGICSCHRVKYFLKIALLGRNFCDN